MDNLKSSQGGIPCCLESSIPTSEIEAAHLLRRWAGVSREDCQNASRSEILPGWFALQYLLPGLHPEDGLEHGDETELWPAGTMYFPHISEAMSRYYVQSGWPVALAGLLSEMWRRYENNEVSEEEFYCSLAQKRGILQKLANNAANCTNDATIGEYYNL